jgi:hypothetical protein
MRAPAEPERCRRRCGSLLAGDDRAWLELVSCAARPLLHDGVGVVSYFYDRTRPSARWLDEPDAIGADPAVRFARVVVSGSLPLGKANNLGWVPLGPTRALRSDPLTERADAGALSSLG